MGNPRMLLLVLVVIVGLAECGTHHASIKSKYGQLVTSSTLRWVHVSSSESIPLDGVPSGTGKSKQFVCRAEHHGALLVGQTKPMGGGYCVVGFVNKLYK